MDQLTRSSASFVFRLLRKQVNAHHKRITLQPPRQATVEIAELLKRGEGPTLEFKSTVPSPSEIARLVSSMSNTNGGTILVGVAETPMKVVGIDWARFEKAVKLAQKQLHGSPQWTSQCVIHEGMNVGVIHVSQSTELVGSDAGYFERNGDRDTPIGAEQIARKLGVFAGLHETLHAIPEAIEGMTRSNEDLRASNESLTQKTHALTAALDRANSWKMKLFWAAVGALCTSLSRWCLELVAS